MTIPCPKCGSTDAWYPEAVPTGREVERNGWLVPELKIHPTAGHCLNCDHFEDARKEQAA